MVNAHAGRPAPSALIGSTARDAYAHVRPVLDRLREGGHQAVLVGGGVRDLLLGRRVEDWDVATSAAPADVIALWPEAIPTGARHGTVTLLYSGHRVELTTFRHEGPYTDGRRPDWVRFDAGLLEDLSRRDFTINALALDPVDGVYFDPAGGEEDVRARLVRAVGDPDRRFAEDGLRPLRGIRLATVLEFSIEPATLAAMSRARDTVSGVARERVRDELMKLLAAARPSPGIELLRTTGLLDLVIPELLESVGVTQNRYHAHDVYVHTLEALDAAPAGNPRVRLAALLHDVGKPRTRVEAEGEATFYDHQTVGAAMAAEILARLRFAVEDQRQVSHLVAEHMFHYTPEWSNAAVRRFLRRVGPEHVDDLFALRRADDQASGTGKDSGASLAELSRRIEGILAREEALAVRDLAVGGSDLQTALALSPGPEIGRLLRELLDRVLEDPSLNQRDRLLKLAAQLRRST